MRLARPLTIAIDGPAASGKSTIGALLAERLGYVYFDTGVMYRAVAWMALKRGIAIGDEYGVTELTRTLKIEVIRPTVDDGRQYTVLAEGEDITWDIRRDDVNAVVSPVSTYLGVREALVDQQRRIGQAGRIVMVGRDIGTVVLPDADLKVYLDATLDQRARRRYREMVARGEEADYAEVRASVQRRDEIDSGRALSPLRPADDAHIVDTTCLSIAQVMEQVQALVDGYKEA